MYGFGLVAKSSSIAARWLGPMSPAVKGMGIVSLHVTDFDRARTFYAKAFGLKERSAMADAKWAEFEVPGASAIGIHGWESGCKAAGGRPPGTVTGMILEVADARAFADHVVKSGGKLTDPIEKMPWGPLGGTVADPDGNEFVISEAMGE